jgi:lantibiotic modifying enzyme
LNVLQLVSQAVPNPQTLDLISGSAGAIAVLLAAYRQLNCACLLERAVEHGEVLLTHGNRSDEGLSWSGHRMPKNLTGFSHGTAGIGWALVELHQASGDARFLHAGLDAFAYERTHFNAELGNWPDYRRLPASYMSAWCHGAAGIGLSRVRAWEMLRHEKLLSEATVALKTLVADLPSIGNHSLCHGAAGNADILIYASEKLARPDLLEVAQAAGLQGLERFEERRLPWPCGLAGATELPDLMLGLAGIGHFYLRLANPLLPTPLLPI